MQAGFSMDTDFAQAIGTGFREPKFGVGRLKPLGHHRIRPRSRIFDGPRLTQIQHSIVRGLSTYIIHVISLTASPVNLSGTVTAVPSTIE